MRLTTGGHVRVLLVFGSLAAAALFALLLLSSILTGNWMATALVGVGLAVSLPVPGRRLAAGLGRWAPALRAVTGFGLLAATGYAMLAFHPPSIYRDDSIRAQFHALYDQKMRSWPLPYEDRFIDTDYGPVHVIVSGPEDAPPMLLLHASGVGSWSWRVNAEGLGAEYRLYAIDTIGDVGKSEYDDLTHVLRTREDQADLYADIMDRLGIDGSAIVVGASEGGFIASNLAVHRPERVDRLILLGPMGYAGATGAVLRIMGAQFMPLGPVQDATFRWAFSDAPAVIAEFNEWFRLLMSDAFPVKVAPFPLPVEERRSIAAPTLFVFGTRDNLVGDPEAARALVSDMPDASVAVVEAGHLMAVERPAEIEALILDFLAETR
jgi:pimeloyl-ACP methyl ester carboxylesterase